MTDVFKVADLLINHSVKNFGHDIDIIACYGSQARGDSRKDSDLDIFYTPTEGKNPPINRTFLLEGLLYDFWGLSWKTLEGFATGNIRGWAFAPALVNQAKILYSRSEDQVSRLNELKSRTGDLQKPDAKPQMIRRALNHFNKIMVHLVNLDRAREAGNLLDLRFSAWKILLGVWECLALGNQVYFEKGLAKSLSKTSRFVYKPHDLDKMINVIIISSNPEMIQETCEKMINETRLVLRELQNSIKPSAVIQDQFNQFYPEMKDIITKLLAACKRGDHLAAYTEAMILQTEVALTMSQITDAIGNTEFNLFSELTSMFDEYKFPDLMSNSYPDLAELKKKAILFDIKLRRFLQENSVELCEYNTLEEFSKTMV
ncbi:MAG: nucleotidyltransferase domain-containing protein [Candidatus Cloacimonetes bacterium]|nr:nucleotidyltransferase domain-containing protein [Candidatus Cloacimonadota bacterium]